MVGNIKVDVNYKVQITVSSWENAFDMIIALFGNMTGNAAKSKRAGYTIFDLDSGAGWASDLVTSFEVNFYNGKTIKIWIDE